jgi:hypothetical protein
MFPFLGHPYLDLATPKKSSCLKIAHELKKKFRAIYEKDQSVYQFSEVMQQ